MAPHSRWQGSGPSRPQAGRTITAPAWIQTWKFAQVSSSQNLGPKPDHHRTVLRYRCEAWLASTYKNGKHGQIGSSWTSVAFQGNLPSLPLSLVRVVMVLAAADEPAAAAQNGK